MFKNRNEVSKISNIFFLVMGSLSFVSVVSLLSGNIVTIEYYSKVDYLFNLIMMIIYTIVSVLILLFTNKKNILYKDEFSVSRRVFNLFVVISIMSMIVTISANILNYFLYDNLSWHSLVVVVFGYVPAYIIAFKEVSKDELLNVNNKPKINIANIVIVYLLMQYYINIISMLSGIIFGIDDIVLLLMGLCWAFIWICVVVIAYKLINKKEDLNFKKK